MSKREWCESSGVFGARGDANAGDTQPVSVPELTNNGAGAAPAKVGNFDEQETIVRVLGETKGRVGGANGAAARLGLKRTTLIARMKKLGIDGRQVLDANRYSGVEVSLPEVAAASGEISPGHLLLVH